MKKLLLLLFIPILSYGQDVIRTWDDTDLVVRNVTVEGVISGVPELEFSTVAQMKAFDFSQVADGARIKCNGYNVANDGFFGPDVFWDAASTAAANGITIFDPTVAGNGRLIRTFTSVVNVLWGGVYNDGVTDTTTSLRQVVDYWNSLGGTYGNDEPEIGQITLYFPSGTYYSSSGMMIHTNGTGQSIIGEGPTSVLKNIGLNLMDYRCTVQDIHIVDDGIRDLSLTGTVTSSDYDLIGSGTDFIAHSGTALAGTETTIQLDAGASGSNDAYNGLWIYISGGTGSGQTREIIDYVGSTKGASIEPEWATTPDATSTFQVGELVPGVWIVCDNNQAFQVATITNDTTATLSDIPSGGDIVSGQNISNVSFGIRRNDDRGSLPRYNTISNVHISDKTFGIHWEGGSHDNLDNIYTKDNLYGMWVTATNGFNISNAVIVNSYASGFFAENYGECKIVNMIALNNGRDDGEMFANFHLAGSSNNNVVEHYITQLTATVSGGTRDRTITGIAAGTTTAKTGTITTVGTAVTGSGTLFTSELETYDWIRVSSNEYGQVSSVTDNTNLVLFAPMVGGDVSGASYETGTSVVTTSAAHQYNAGLINVTLSGTTDYNATVEVNAITSATEFTIPLSYVSSQTGDSKTIGWDVIIDIPVSSEPLNRVNDIFFTGGNINYLNIKRGYNINFVNTRLKNQILIEDETEVNRIMFIRNARGRTSLKGSYQDTPIIGAASGWGQIAYKDNGTSFGSGFGYMEVSVPDGGTLNSDQTANLNSIQVSEVDINITADTDVNLTATADVNLTSTNVIRLDSTAGQIITNGAQYSVSTGLVADDAAVAVTPPFSTGVMMITEGNGSETRVAHVAYRVADADGRLGSVGHVGTDWELNAASGSAPTGTTGTDTKMTVFALDDAGETDFYIENRLGSARTFYVTFIR